MCLLCTNAILASSTAALTNSECVAGTVLEGTCTSWHDSWCPGSRASMQQSHVLRRARCRRVAQARPPSLHEEPPESGDSASCSVLAAAAAARRAAAAAATAAAAVQRAGRPPAPPPALAPVLVGRPPPPAPPPALAPVPGVTVAAAAAGTRVCTDFLGEVVYVILRGAVLVLLFTTLHASSLHMRVTHRPSLPWVAWRTDSHS